MSLISKTQEDVGSIKVRLNDLIVMYNTIKQALLPHSGFDITGLQKELDSMLDKIGDIGRLLQLKQGLLNVLIENRDNILKEIEDLKTNTKLLEKLGSVEASNRPIKRQTDDEQSPNQVKIK